MTTRPNFPEWQWKYMQGMYEKYMAGRNKGNPLGPHTLLCTLPSQRQLDSSTSPKSDISTVVFGGILIGRHLTRMYNGRTDLYSNKVDSLGNEKFFVDGLTRRRFDIVCSLQVMSVLNLCLQFNTFAKNKRIYVLRNYLRVKQQ